MTVTADTARGALEGRILAEGYGPGAWHGPDLQAALADVTPELAFYRPAAGRHNIAEIALHHAYCTRDARAKLSGRDPEPFIFEGTDWFDLPDSSRLSWAATAEIVDREHRSLETTVAEIAAGRLASLLSETERFDLVMGITCHAIYHAGQVQLIKRLHPAPAR